MSVAIAELSPQPGTAPSSTTAAFATPGSRDAPNSSDASNSRDAPNSSDALGSRDASNARSAYDRTLLATVMAERHQRRAAIFTVGIIALAFIAAAPFARIMLVPASAFIPAYESALFLIDVITMVMLLGQFAQRRSASLLVLAAGYLYDAAIVVPHALSFPGVITPTGWLGAGSQTTAWLYMFWHGGFPLFVMGYAILGRPRIAARRDLPASAVFTVLAATIVSVGLLAFLATHADALLPAIMAGNSYTTTMVFVVGTVWLITLVALVTVALKRPYTILDIWLMAVLCAWLCDIALSAVLNANRYDLGFYAGRIYGLFAASFVLIVMLLETVDLHTRLAQATDRLAAQARDLDLRVQQRTVELSHANRQLSAILEAVPVGIYMVGRDGLVSHWTASAERLFGFSQAEAQGLPPPHIPEGESGEFRARLRRIVDSADSQPRLEVDVRHRDGTIMPVSERWAPLADQSGQIYGMVCAAADISAARKFENQLRQSQKMEAIGNLTGGMAHDFNNLLGIVIGNLDLLIDLHGDNPDIEEFAREGLDAALRGADLTRRLLAFARRQPLQPQITEVNDLVSNITTLLKRTLGEDVRVKLELGKGIWPVVIDPVQLESAITNLANNARDAMNGGGRLLITTSNRYLDEDYASLHPELKPGEYALIEVSDSGSGMPPEVVARIFEPFFTTKEPGKGTGLGLAMVFGFMKQSGGHMNVYSEVGIGTTFRLYLPRAAAALKAEDEAAQQIRVMGQGERILVVEDDPGLRRVVVRQLTELGYAVVEAEDSASAIAALESEQVDLVFTDVVMPGGHGGYELAGIAQSRWPHVKVIMTSGFPERMGNEAQLPNLRLLSKPYRREELARAVSEALAAAPLKV